MIRQPDYANNQYDPLETVTLEARPLAGYVFDSWSGSVDGIADTSQRVVSFKMGDANVRTITASFAASDVHCGVTAISEPSGGGSIGLQPAQPSAGYGVNQSVRVWATPQKDYVFSHWTGDLIGSENPTTLLVGDNKVIRATFNPTLTVYCSPSKGGSVAVQPAEPAKGYVPGTVVTMSATAAKGYRFVSWEGAASGSERSVTLTVDEPKTITARFTADSPSRWWLWVIVALASLFGALILLRLVYSRMNRGWSDEPIQPDD